jgi:acyl-CoA thioester hydrolase
MHLKAFSIPPEVIDRNGHVNNVAFLQWMQDIAIEHYTVLGGFAAEAPFGTWYVREHKLEYLAPAFLGNEIEIRTWVETVGRVRSLRRYEFVRASDRKLLVRAESDWVFVHAISGKPLAIPEAVRAIFPPLPVPGTET